MDDGIRYQDINVRKRRRFFCWYVGTIWDINWHPVRHGYDRILASPQSWWPAIRDDIVAIPRIACPKQQLLFFRRSGVRRVVGSYYDYIVPGSRNFPSTVVERRSTVVSCPDHGYLLSTGPARNDHIYIHISGYQFTKKTTLLGNAGDGIRIRPLRQRAAYYRNWPRIR